MLVYENLDVGAVLLAAFRVVLVFSVWLAVVFFIQKKSWIRANIWGEKKLVYFSYFSLFWFSMITLISLDGLGRNVSIWSEVKNGRVYTYQGEVYKIKYTTAGVKFYLDEEKYIGSENRLGCFWGERWGSDRDEASSFMKIGYIKFRWAGSTRSCIVSLEVMKVKKNNNNDVRANTAF
ncbi:hypothetical protein GCM10011297_23790 [Bacterioplanes sanyensis]|uniref:hypothetical protein n=1 Tax=Bacterioplanes sanyensis TaxID=1249553 RepID=UPI00167B5E0E|nr:hypothetical protein [Bacterioplanes sanyensis]GGY49958.1 hypothetical protein GCM10011297_23790 [Bacterioplanes sanyensis]